MKNFFKKILIGVLLLFGLIWLAGVILNDQLKRESTELVSRIFAHPAKVGSAGFNIFDGLYLDKVLVYDYDKKVFIQIDQIRLKPAYWASLRERRWLVRSKIKEILFIKNGKVFDHVSDLRVISVFKKDKVKLENGICEYKNIRFDFFGEVHGDRQPAVKLRVSGGGFDFNLAGQDEPGDFKIDELSLKGPDSYLIAKGVFITGPRIARIKGQGQVDCADIEKFIKVFQIDWPGFYQAQPKGKIRVKFSCRSKAKVDDWKSDIFGQSRQMLLYRISFQQAQAALESSPGRTKIKGFSAIAAKGRFDYKEDVDFTSRKKSVYVKVSSIDLLDLVRQLDLEEKGLDGRLSLQARLDSDIFQWKNMTGTGKLQIKDSDIWKIETFKGLGEFLFIPGFGDIVFKSGNCDLVFKGDSVILKNIKLVSSLLVLAGAGEIFSNGNIKALFLPEFNSLLIRTSRPLAKIVSGFTGEANLAVEVNGTLDKPVYGTRPYFKYPLKGVKDYLEELIK